MSLSRAQQVQQLANLCKLRGRMRRNRVASFVAQGYSINHSELQRMLSEAKSEEEMAAILQRYGT